MTWIALGCILLGLLLGGAGMRRLGRMAGRAWRPGAGMLALALFIGAAAMAVRQAYGPAVVILIIGLVVAMGVRRSQGGPRASGAGGKSRSTVGGMSIEEARSILGVGENAGADEVQAAYLRLIRRAHPDQGGTSGLAAQLNTARDVLLKKR